MLDNYEKLDNGVIKQIKIINEIRKYDPLYIKNSYNVYSEMSKYISYLRLGFLISKVNNIQSILDIGYGNGDFLKTSSNYITNCYGYDISGYEIEDNNIKIVDNINDNYDVITFFDSLEHFDDINFIKNLNTKYIFISLPWCHYFSDDWFKNWKHRREDEHLWHFNDIALINFMIENGYEIVGNVSNIEDIIRTSVDDNKNILSAIFKKL